MYSNILVSTDGSEFADKAVREAATLAKELGSRLVLFYAVPHYEMPHLADGMSAPNYPKDKEEAQRVMEAEAKRILAHSARNVTVAGVAVEQQFTVNHSPYEAIIEAAKKFKCELIVMASHGRRGLSGVVLGSETQKVLTHSTIPVLVVR